MFIKTNSNLVEKLKKRWKVNSAWQVLLILMVFAATGTTISKITDPVLGFLGADSLKSWQYVIAYILIILPIYNVTLLVFGTLVGQFEFFLNFEKRFFSRIFGIKIKEQEPDGCNKPAQETKS